LSRGAQPSETALKLLKKVGIWEKFTEAKAKGQEVTQG
jgi:ribosomal protein S16